MIVSNGTRSPHLSTRRLAHALQPSFPQLQVCLYPWSVQELGATTNVQAAILGKKYDDDFVSLEMAKGTRLGLIDDSRQIDEFSKALTAAVRQMSKE